MKKQAILNGKKFQIINKYGTGEDYVYQFEKDESDSNYKLDKIIQYYALGKKLIYWRSSIVEKLTDNYLTVSEHIMNQMVKVRIKLEDITPYEGELLTVEEAEKEANKEKVK
jgi:hypothetical protein